MPQAFLSNLIGEDEAKRRSTMTDAEADATPEETAGGDANNEGEPNEGDAGTEGDDTKQTDDDPDAREVEIKVGEETKKATIRDLKRLYGQGFCQLARPCFDCSAGCGACV